MSLRKSSRLTPARLERYGQMLWSMHRRTQRFKSPLTTRKPRFPITKTECAHQRQIMRDLAKAEWRTRSRDRRIAGPFMKMVRFVDGMAKTREAKTRNEERSQNVV